MPDFTLTPEQDAIVFASQTTSDNLAVIARAGAAKTSTLVLIAEALPETEIICLAFNKKIQEEMAERLPANCTAMTLNGLGHKAWYQFLRKRITLNAKKCYDLLRARLDKLDREEQKEMFDLFGETLDAIKQSKHQGWVPQEFKGHWKPLVGDEDFFLSLEMEPTDLQRRIITDVAAASFRAALAGEIDFDDQILCPAVCSVSLPAFPLVMVDEAQDLSPINHVILKKLVKRNRIIAVGDPCQAIYGFRGADENSLGKLQSLFDMQPLYLTVSFRCSKEVCRNAQWRAPDMTSPDWATEGKVGVMMEWGAEILEDGDAIICRNNAPLFSMAIRLIRNGRMPEIAGRDIGKPLLKIMKKLGKPGTPRLAALDSLVQWKEQQLKRARTPGTIHDQYSCIRIMIEATKTLGDAQAYLEHLLNRSGRIHLMTGHKSKGLEFRNVFFLDQHLLNIEKGQDANVKYVIETRAKENLIYVESKFFVGGEPEDE